MNRQLPLMNVIPFDRLCREIVARVISIPPSGWNAPMRFDRMLAEDR
jgi:hypothetical protein